MTKRFLFLSKLSASLAVLLAFTGYPVQASALLIAIGTLWLLTLDRWSE